MEDFKVVGSQVISILLHEFNNEFKEIKKLNKDHVVISTITHQGVSKHMIEIKELNSYENFTSSVMAGFSFFHDATIGFIIGLLYTLIFIIFLVVPFIIISRKFKKGMSILKREMILNLYHFIIDHEISLFKDQELIGTYSKNELAFYPINYSTLTYVYKIVCGEHDLGICYISEQQSLPIIKFKRS